MVHTRYLEHEPLMALRSLWLNLTVPRYWHPVRPRKQRVVRSKLGFVMRRRYAGMIETRTPTDSEAESAYRMWSIR